MNPTPEPAPLAVTADPALCEDLARLAAAAGVVLDLVGDAQAALRRWSAAPVVLVGADQAASLARLQPGRRAAVLVVGWAGQPDSVFRSGVELGAEAVLELPAATEVLTDALTDLGEPGRLPAAVVGVLAGSGGAGATTFACALGQQGGRSGPALVIDLDQWGPGADRVLGLDRLPGVRWDDLTGSMGRLSGRSLREAVPRRDGVGVLSWAPGDPGGPGGPGSDLAPDLVPDLVREAMSAAVRGHETVVVDLPRGGDALVGEAYTRCRLVVLVVRPTLTGVAAAVRTAERVPDRERLRVLVRAGRDGVDPRRVAAAVGAPLLCAMPDQRGLAEALDLGLGPARSRRGPLVRACRAVLAA